MDEFFTTGLFLEVGLLVRDVLAGAAEVARWLARHRVLHERAPGSSSTRTPAPH
ncbi:MAG TPA: hypothetical protein VHV51_09010 [Polyangiaceae bacterium]|nr:hypothetical protein [Polyangiaceae bacterium]